MQLQMGIKQGYVMEVPGGWSGTSPARKNRLKPRGGGGGSCSQTLIEGPDAGGWGFLRPKEDQRIGEEG